MARLRPFIRHPLTEELTDILRARFPKAKLTLNGNKVGKHECYDIDARYTGPDASDLIDCLQMLKYTYGNIGFSFCGDPPRRRKSK
jgi:hypothetical protein